MRLRRYEWAWIAGLLAYAVACAIATAMGNFMLLVLLAVVFVVVVLIRVGGGWRKRGGGS